jgi:hypothetical protein
LIKNVTWGGGGSKKCGKSVTYYLNGPLQQQNQMSRTSFLSFNFLLLFTWLFLGDINLHRFCLDDVIDARFLELKKNQNIILLIWLIFWNSINIFPELAIFLLTSYFWFKTKWHYLPFEEMRLAKTVWTDHIMQLHNIMCHFFKRHLL